MILRLDASSFSSYFWLRKMHDELCDFDAVFLFFAVCFSSSPICLSCTYWPSSVMSLGSLSPVTGVPISRVCMFFLGLQLISLLVSTVRSLFTEFFFEVKFQLNGSIRLLFLSLANTRINSELILFARCTLKTRHYVIYRLI